MARFSPNAPRRAGDPDQPFILGTLPNSRELATELHAVGFSLGGATQIANAQLLSHPTDRLRLAALLEHIRRTPGRTKWANIVLER